MLLEKLSQAVADQHRIEELLEHNKADRVYWKSIELKTAATAFNLLTDDAIPSLKTALAALKRGKTDVVQDYLERLLEQCESTAPSFDRTKRKVMP